VTQCPTCGKHLDDSARFCPDDGTPLTETAAPSSTRTPTGQPTQKLTLQLPTMLGNRYRLIEVRGGGGMAKVYKALDVTLERDVAVKLINPELRTETEFDARFQREARIASQLADPHIVVVHDFGIDATHGPYLVMEYLQGQSLRERLAQGALPIKPALQLCAQVFLALIHAHDKGIVHRDIKPDNIFLLNQSGVRLHVRVLDFGIARIYRGDKESHAETLTQPGAVLGTPRYMSPEQLAGNPVDARSDLYSAALVIYEALTGQLPYVSNRKLVELCPEASPALQELLEHCLQPNPNDRPASAVEVYLRLQELGKASGVLLLPPGAMDKLLAARQVASEPTTTYVPSSLRSTAWRRRMLIGLGALLLALLIWGLVAWLKGPGANLFVDRESLMGIRIGDVEADVLPKVAVNKHPTANPWLQPVKDPAYVGHVLQPEDIGVSADGSAQFVLAVFSPDERGCILSYEKSVCAVVVRSPHKAATGRGLRMDASVADMLRLYPEEHQLDAVKVGTSAGKAGPGGQVDVYRFDRLGIGFEVQGARVVGMTLYQPRN
jgi:serine/threonine-protein kinase